MTVFAKLIEELAFRKNEKDIVECLTDYFSIAPEEDKLWAISILYKKKPKRIISLKSLKEIASKNIDISSWLFDVCLQATGDLSETIALIFENNNSSHHKGLAQWLENLEQIRAADSLRRQSIIESFWKQLNQKEKILFNKLLTGTLRVSVNDKLIAKALSRLVSIDEKKLLNRLQGSWSADDTDFNSFIAEKQVSDEISMPYPFHYGLEFSGEYSKLGSCKEWQIENKWNGLRAQVIIRNDQIFVWSKNEELLTNSFPEYQSLLDELPNGTVLEGELICFKNGSFMPEIHLHSRIKRKKNSKQQLEQYPAVFLVYDLLEFEGIDLRKVALTTRRKKLEKVLDDYCNSSILLLSEVHKITSWEESEELLSKSRIQNSSGLMLKRKNSGYVAGRMEGDWWKLKPQPFETNAILMYLQQNNVVGSKYQMEYTFGFWKNAKLISTIKASEGLVDEESEEIRKYAKKNTIEKFGPVRHISPDLVFRLSFEEVALSKRHKSGVLVKNAKILGQNREISIKEVSTLAVFIDKYLLAES